MKLVTSAIWTLEIITWMYEQSVFLTFSPFRFVILLDWQNR